MVEVQSVFCELRTLYVQTNFKQEHAGNTAFACLNAGPPAEGPAAGELDKMSVLSVGTSTACSCKVTGRLLQTPRFSQLLSAVAFPFLLANVLTSV